MPLTVEDSLGRADLAAHFCSFLRASAGARLYMVDGDWGSGKTVFLRLCAAELRRPDEPPMQVVEFNAWKQSHTKNPLLDLTYFISSQATESRTALLRRQARLAVRQIAVGLSDAAGRRTHGLLNLSALFTRHRSEWELAQRRLAAFHRRLAKLAATAPLVVLIDDVDRCEPRYAAHLLERAYVMFDVPNVHVVLAAHRDALERSIRSVHGEHYAAHSYLQGVIRHWLELPRVSARAVSDLIGADLAAAAETLGIDRSDLRAVCDILALVPLCVYGGIRNLERVTEVAARRLGEMTAPGATGQYSGSLPLGSVLVLAAALAAVQLISPAAHRALLRRPTDGAAAFCTRISATNWAICAPILMPRNAGKRCVSASLRWADAAKPTRCPQSTTTSWARRSTSTSSPRCALASPGCAQRIMAPASPVPREPTSNCRCALGAT